MKKHSLNCAYTLYYADEQTNSSGMAGMQSLPAVVPGNVEIDLMNAGVLPDIFFGNNVKCLRPYEFYRWRYERTFVAPALEAQERAFLHFEGVDCVAEYSLNGEKFASSENALFEHRFEVTGLLKPGENTLAVDLRSPMLYAASKSVDAY